MKGIQIVDYIVGTKILNTYKYLLEVQYEDSKTLNMMSRRAVLDLWETAKNLPYYKDFDTVDSTPILNKGIIKNQFDKFVNSKIPESKRITKKTGGSTGEPFIYYTGLESQSYLWAGIMLSWNSAGWNPGDKMAFLAGSSIVGKGLKKKVFYRLMNILPFDSFDLTAARMTRLLSKLKSSKVQFMYGYANAIYHLAVFNTEYKHNVRLASVITTAENLTEKMRDTIQRSFQCEVFNQYGCNDAGISAFECKSHCGLHLINTRAYVEVVDDKLISTDTTNYVMPMIRYDSGDRVSFSKSSCPCGRGFPLISEVFGRSNDCVVNKRTGAYIHSEFFNHLFREDREISSFQVQIAGEAMKILFKLLPKFQTLSKADEYLQLVKKKTGYTNVEFACNQEFYKANNGKTPLIVNHNFK